MDVLGLLVGVFSRWRTVYRDVEELWFDGSDGCAIARVCSVAGGYVLLFPVVVLCVYCEFLSLPVNPKGQ